MVNKLESKIEKLIEYIDVAKNERDYTSANALFALMLDRLSRGGWNIERILKYAKIEAQYWPDEGQERSEWEKSHAETDEGYYDIFVIATSAGKSACIPMPMINRELCARAYAGAELVERVDHNREFNDEGSPQERPSKMLACIREGEPLMSKWLLPDEQQTATGPVWVADDDGGGEWVAF